MAKHRSKWTFKAYHKRIKEGRGRGTYKDYLPWITIHDLASRGVVSRVYGMKTGRIHHLLSRNETAFFYILDSSDRVLDIREQFPLLGVEETLRIAGKAGIRHPRDPQSLYPYVLTSDFVITMEGRFCVRTVKETRELSKLRVREKLEIERRYWAERGIDWKIVTEKDIDFQKARNLEWLRKSAFFSRMLPEGCLMEDVLSYFMHLYDDSCLPVCEVARMTEEAFRLEAGLGLLGYQYLIMDGRLEVDLSKPMDLVSARTGNSRRKDSWIQIYA